MITALLYVLGHNCYSTPSKLKKYYTKTFMFNFILTYKNINDNSNGSVMAEQIIHVMYICGFTLT